MYDLPHHKEKNDQLIKEFIAKYPLAIMTGCDAENKPVLTQIPVILEEKDGKKILRGHFMKNTDHHRAFVHNNNTLVVFTGHNTYVSATWYSNPNMASTWNYMSVHAKGKIKFLDDKGLEDVLQLTSLHFENYDEQSPTVYTNLPEDFKKHVLHMIVAFEIEISEMDTVFKLSQDRDAVSYQNIIEKLKTQSEDAKVIAAEMEKRMEELF